MSSIFDLLAAALFAGTVGVFIVRFRHEEPRLFPYALISAVAAVGYWLGVHGGGGAAAVLMIAGAFLLLHIASLPYPEDLDDASRS